MSKLLLLALLALLSITTTTTASKPDLLPVRFTQGWTTTYQGDSYATGKIFYDSEANSERINVIDGPDQPFCGFIEGAQECSMMNANKSIYFIVPSVKKCCYDSSDYDTTPRDMFDDFVSAGDVTIDGITYNKWIYDFEFFQSDLRFILINQKNRQGVMRRFGLAEQDESDDGWFEFWPNSYTDKFSSKVAFQVPKYCVIFDNCDIDMQKALRSTMKNNFLMNMLKGLKRGKITESLRQQ